MKAVLFHEHGGPDVLRYEDFPDPTLGPNDVLVRVEAVALNHLDLFVRQGWPGLKLPLPHILGADVAGEIAAVGDNVLDLDPGERVVLNPGLSCGECEYCVMGEDSMCVDYKILGEHVHGGYAQSVAVPARNVVRLPTDYPFVEAAAAPLVFMTAWRLLMTKASIRAGEDVLILGAGSGVSTAAIQIAKLAGCTVYVTSGSEEKLKKAKELGADVLINHGEMKFDRAIWELTGKRGVDVVLDHVGQATWKRSIRSLRRGGRMVVCGHTSGALVEVDVRYVYWRQIAIHGSTMASQREFDEVMRLVLRRKLRPVVDRTYPLEDAAEAHRRLEEAKQFGKVVLTVPD
jgi:NADPH:quinone reductase-like Zn-dependent oxidoreductase